MNDNGSSEIVVAVQSLSRRFGGTVALDNVDLSIPRGVVFGLVGANGAGKTTLIKHLLGLLKPQNGQVRIFGIDPVADPPAILGRIGYVSEEHDLPGWMRVWELMSYYQAFFPKWDVAFAESLRRDFELDRQAKLKTLSKGQRARAGLLVALAHRPEFLILDEPSAGLDPIVRRDILEAIVRAIAEEGRTVLFSSHLLDEVERVSDHVTMILRGKIVLSAPLDEIKMTHRNVTLQFPQPLAAAPNVAGALRWEGAGQEWRGMFHGDAEAARLAAINAGGEVIDLRAPSLDEIFLARMGEKRTRAEA
jgi:ABC-2 type transport system ATP-binding protein